MTCVRQVRVTSVTSESQPILQRLIMHSRWTFHRIIGFILIFNQAHFGGGMAPCGLRQKPASVWLRRQHERFHKLFIEFQTEALNSVVTLSVPEHAR